MAHPFEQSTSIWGPKPPTKCKQCNGAGVLCVPSSDGHGAPNCEPDPCNECDGDGYIPVKQ